MGKLIFKVVVMLAIVVGMSNYMMYIMTGKSPFSGLSSDMSLSAPDVSNIIPKGNERAYKWTDENGVVHYSSEAPDHLDSETMDVNPNTNIIQGITAPEETETASTAPASAQPQMPQGNIYNPETIRKLIDDAKSVQGTLNDRYKALEDQ